jgi:hypothetical protein
MQIGPKIRFDSHTLGNLVKNVSPALAFTPLGLAGTAGASFLGDLGRGKNVGQAALGAAGNVAIGAGARGVAGHFGVLGQGGAPAAAGVASAPAPTTPIPGAGGPSDLMSMAGDAGAPAVPTPNTPIPSGGTAPDTGLGTVEHGRLALPQTPDLTQTLRQPTDPRGFLGRLAGGAGDLASFAEGHDKTAAAGLNALGSLAGQGAQNRRLASQTNLENIQAQQLQAQIDRQKAQDAAMNPLREAIYGRLGQTIGGAQPNTPIPTG